MAREFAKIKAAIWQDDDFRALPIHAQHLYFVILTDPELSYCGVTDWRPRRMAPKAHQWGLDTIYDAATILTEKHLLIIDEETEEVLVRSFLRHDGVMQHNKLCISATRAFATIGSNHIRGVVVHELKRLENEFPEWPAWGRDQVKEVLKRNAISPDLAPPLAPGLAPNLAPGLAAAQGQPQPIGQPVPYNSNSNSNIQPTHHPDSSKTADAALRPDVEEILNYLDEALKKNDVKLPGRNKTNTDAARLLIDKDERSVEQIKKAINFATTDSFWRANILSMTKLREKYDQVRLSAQRGTTTPQQKQDDAANQRWALARQNLAKTQQRSQQ